MMHSCCSERRMWIWSLCLIFFSLSYTILVVASSSSSPVKHLCLPDQKDALWEFKNEFYVVQEEDADNKTERWKKDSDCCSWDGVSCDPKTGKVVKLDLYGSSLNGPLRSNSSLFKLLHLRSLDLGLNNISGILPDSIGNFKYLKVLDLTSCKFLGTVPSSLGNLSHLTDLAIFANDFTGELPDFIGNFKNLKVLSFGGCKFYGKIPSSLGNLSHLTDLDLSVNDFTGELPDSMANLNRLTKLDLNRNKLSGKFPSLLLNLSELTYIDLRYGQFEGKLPSNMSSLTKLEYFDVSRNSFYGSFPSSLFMIPSLFWVDMAVNDLVGPLEIGNISSSSSKLEILDLGENNFTGPIPESISRLVGLQLLDLSYWNTEKRMVDFSIFLHLKSMNELYLSYLNTRSSVDLSLFSSLESLVDLDLSGNNVKISSTLHLPASIQGLTLSSCNIVVFPKFLQNQSSLVWLDISANHIKGQVPEWLWSLPVWYVNISQNFFTGFEGSADVVRTSLYLRFLDISSNAFKNPFPLLPNSTEYFLGSDNQFSGEIPHTICELLQLEILVLSNNSFTGSIPHCFNTSLTVLHLRNNSLSGVFPEESISYDLISFDVGHNRLSGKLPKSLSNCTHLEFLNVEGNRINDEFPFWLRLLPNLEILVLRSNEFHGPISSLGDISLSFRKLRMFDISRNRFSGVLPSDYFLGLNAMSSMVEIVDLSPNAYHAVNFHKSVGFVNKGSNMELIGSDFRIYKTVDISGNRFKGNIPESISLLKELIVLNISNNAFTGHIPPSLDNLTNLESLDLSQNRLTGKIPPELGKLTFLSRMNFSYNKLQGPIPQSTQFQSQDNSSFAENLGLCGAPLQETCGGGGVTTQHQDVDADEEDDEVISWIAAAISYVPGIVCGITIGYILDSYKPDWFMRIFHSRA